MLVIVEHRDVQQILKLGLDAEALGALDVLQIDAAEGDADVLDHRDDFIGVPGRDLDVHRIHIGEAFEKDAFSLHDGLGRQCAQIAQTQDGGAVGDHRHEVSLGGVLIGEVRIGGDRQHRDGHAWRIGER